MITGIVLIGSILAYYVSSTSINPNIVKPQEISLVAKHDPQEGFVFAEKETNDNSLYSYHMISEITVKKDQPVIIHLINGDKDEKHDFNIDEFNVRIRDLWYFEGDTATFVANKTGTFQYYCSLHPKMHGTLIVQ